MVEPNITKWSEGPKRGKNPLLMMGIEPAPTQFNTRIPSISKWSTGPRALPRHSQFDPMFGLPPKSTYPVNQMTELDMFQTRKPIIPRSRIGQAYRGSKALAFGAGRAAGNIYNAGNWTSRFFTGGSLPQLALGATLVGSAFYFGDKALGRDPKKDASNAWQFMNAMGREMTRKSYGTTVFQQSTQGLVFGLNSRRTA